MHGAWVKPSTRVIVRLPSGFHLSSIEHLSTAIQSSCGRYLGAKRTMKTLLASTVTVTVTCLYDAKVSSHVTKYREEMSRELS